MVLDVLDELPPDPTNLEDVIQSSLFLGRPQQALSQAYQLDPWLSAHMSDIMEALDLIDRDIMECVVRAVTCAPRVADSSTAVPA